MSQRNDKGTSLAPTKRTMFPLGHYRTMAWGGGGVGGQWWGREAININTKQN